MRNRSLALLALLSLSAPGLSAQPVAYSKPTGKWVVDFADGRCLAGREYETAYGKTILYVRPDLLTATGMLMVRFSPDKKDNQQASDLKLFWNGIAEDKPSKFTVYVQSDDKRMLVTRYSADKIAGEQPQLLLDFSANTDMAFEIAGWPALNRVLATCTADLRKSKGITDEVMARVVTWPIAKRDRLSLLSDSDFPANDLRRGHMGIATALYWVGTNGRVQNCDILESSGSQDMDQNVCEAFRKARFQPALDKDGNAVVAPQVQRVEFTFFGN